MVKQLIRERILRQKEEKTSSIVEQTKFENIKT